MTGAVFALPVQAGEDISAKGAKSIVVPVATPECSTREIQPLFSRYARTATSWTLRGGYRSFSDVELQEVDEFDGSSYDVELTVPLNDRFQLRLYYPLSIEGDARTIDGNEPVSIDGNGNTLDFPSLVLDYQFRKASSPGEYNMAAYIGFGHVLNHIDSETRQGHVDRINHRGSALYLGFKADKLINNCWTFIGNAGLRYYWDSDDIHPNGGSDMFVLIEASAAWIYTPQNAWIYPGVEVLYQTTVTDYNSLQVVPQVILPIGSHIDVTAGVSVGLLNDGPSTETRIGLIARF